MHKCAVTVCPEQIEDSRLMCYVHWYALPVEVRKQVNDTYARYKELGRALKKNAHIAQVREGFVAASREYIAAIKTAKVVIDQILTPERVEQ